MLVSCFGFSSVLGGAASSALILSISFSSSLTCWFLRFQAATSLLTPLSLIVASSSAFASSESPAGILTVIVSLTLCSTVTGVSLTTISSVSTACLSVSFICVLHRCPLLPLWVCGYCYLFGWLYLWCSFHAPAFSVLFSGHQSHLRNLQPQHRYLILIAGKQLVQSVNNSVSGHD
ncbi:MAG: hypothetical protein BWX75_01411 [Candidatus Cloacimonetes bacterium ADurb.Bin088]|nr:MAG: hypothetical protein BWX75_01411 [Candidatus Cloacimonetes bacterium ADurb.Bin088]